MQQQPAPRIKRKHAKLTHINDKNRIPVYVKTPKTENILFVGSKMQYNNFWLKMMFIGAAFAGAKKLRPADKQTLAYVDVWAMFDRKNWRWSTSKTKGDSNWSNSSARKN